MTTTNRGIGNMWSDLMKKLKQIISRLKKIPPRLTAKKYEPFELTFEGGDYENPYLAVALSAVFQGPTGERLALEGFWDGENIWKIRFAPTSVGTWTFQTDSNDPLLHNLSGSFWCADSKHRGFLKTKGRHFIYDNGAETPVFRMGDTCWRMFYSKNAMFETHFKPFVDARARQGFNYMMGVLHTVGAPPQNEGGYLWQNGTNLDFIHPEYFKWVDKRIQHLQAKGFCTGLVLTWSQCFAQFTKTQFYRFKRYVVARYAAYDVVWIISGEYTEEKLPQDYGYHAAIIKNGDQYDEGDPYQHPISIHPGGKKSNSRDWATFKPWLGFIMQQYHGTATELAGQILTDRIYGVPVANDEFGYEGPTDPTDPYYFFNNQDEASLRRDAWAIVLSGGYLTFGCLYTYTGKDLIIQTDKLETPGAHAMKHLAHFIRNGARFQEMEPYGNLTSESSHCLALPGKEYIVYLPEGGDVELSMADISDTFLATWYDPLIGNYHSSRVFQSHTKNFFNNPLPGEAVLYVRQVEGVLLRTRILLQGAFDQASGQMGTTLRDRQAIPFSSPYPQAPQTEQTLPDQMTDWILMQLSATPESQPIASKSALLLKDGRVCQNGTADVICFRDIPVGKYYLTIRHRNHLPIMSAQPLDLQKKSICEIDFTTSPDLTYGAEALTAVSIDRWALWAGDVDQDGKIGPGDFQEWYSAAKRNATGYEKSDLNLDGHVSIEDYDRWTASAQSAATSKIPDQS